MLYKEGDRKSSVASSPKKKNSGYERQEAGHQDELIGDKPPVVK
jgi:hypothetical protein